MGCEMHSVTFKEAAAHLWHWVANVGRNPEFEDLASQSTKTLLHPGFVGPTYPTDGTGTLVIGMNPGGGSDTPNMQERGTLLRIRDEASIEAFDELNSVASRLCPTWPIWRNNLLPLLHSVGVDPSSVAYIHAVPFRVPDNAKLSRLYVAAWHRVSSKQAALLNPGRVLLAGKSAGLKLQPVIAVKSRIVTRSIGDSLQADRSAKISASHDSIRSDGAFWM